MPKSNNSSSGIGIAGVLGIVFIVLKLCDVIAWSWLWVLSPFWIPLSIVLAILVVMFLFFLPAAFK